MQSMARISIANLYKTLIPLNSRRKNPPPFHLYCTASSSGNDDSDSDGVFTSHPADDNGSISSRSVKPPRKQKETLYSKISPLGNPCYYIKPLIDLWVKDGNQVRFDELQVITRELRNCRRFSQALEVSEWMEKNKAFTFSPYNHAVHIDLIGKVHGCLSARAYFINLSEVNKTDKTYGALLHCYARQRETVKALSLWQSMKEKGLKLSSMAYNDLMSVYTHTSNYEMVLDLLSEMKENGVSPDSSTYKICLNSYGQKPDIAGMEMLLDEMERQPDVSVDWSTCALMVTFYCKVHFTSKANNFLKAAEEKLPVGKAYGYHHLISLHATLGNKSEVLRLWCLLKNTCKKCVNRDYVNILNNLMRLNELEEAEKILKEWESSGNHYDHRIPYMFINEYIAKKQLVKAKGMLNDLIEKGKLPSIDKGSWHLGHTTIAAECMKMETRSWTDD